MRYIVGPSLSHGAKHLVGGQAITMIDHPDEMRGRILKAGDVVIVCDLDRAYDDEIKFASRGEGQPQIVVCPDIT